MVNLSDKIIFTIQKLKDFLSEDWPKINTEFLTAIIEECPKYDFNKQIEVLNHAYGILQIKQYPKLYKYVDMEYMLTSFKKVCDE